MINFDGKIALVTGASRGIGAAIALDLAKNGAYVIGTSTSVEGAKGISKMLTDNKLHGEGIALDITDGTKVEEVINNLALDNKAPQILVNNAGITLDNLLLRMEDEEWFKVIETNLTGVYRITKLCLKYMLKQRFGRIIQIGSVVGSMGNSGQANYAATKAGIAGFSRSLAQEIGSRNITVNVVAPGFIDTEMTEKLPDLVKEELLKRVPLKRLGTVADVAHAVSFLASDYAAYITGETLNVNGGMYMA